MISDEVSIQLIISTAGVAMAAIASYFAYKARATSAETHKIVNSRMTEFMEMAKKSFKAEGRLEGKADAEREAKDKAVDPAKDL